MRKIIFFAFCILLTTFYRLPTASAHLAGQPPFFKINGKYANLYHVPLTSLYDFDLPQDGPSENYLVNQQLQMELDGTKLPAPPDVIAKTEFDWDFGDSTPHGSGLKNQHTYTKIGSFILKIYANDNTTPQPQLLESALINVLPNKDYQLPQAKIVINGQSSKDPLTDILHFDLRNPLKFDCGTADCFWDFGDQKSATGTTQTHQYSTNLPQIFVVLRVKDKNGFIADNFAEIEDSKGSPFPSNQPNATNKPKASSSLPFTALGAIAVLVILTVMGLVLRAPGRGKHQQKP